MIGITNTEKIDNSYFIMPGDTITLGWGALGLGLVADSRKNMSLLFPINKIIKATSVTCTAFVANIWCNGNYVGSTKYQSAGVNFLSDVTQVHIVNNGIFVFMQRSTAWTGGTTDHTVTCMPNQIVFQFS